MNKDILEILEDSLSMMSNEKLLELVDKYKYTNFELYDCILNKLARDRIKIVELKFTPDVIIEGFKISKVKVTYSIDGKIDSQTWAYDQYVKDPQGLLTIAYDTILHKDKIIKDATINN